MSYESQWRARATPIIERVLAETKGQSDKAVRAALYAAYPFGPRAYHPYRIWNDEVARQRGTKPTLGTRDTAKSATDPAETDQTDLFAKE